MLHPIAQFVPQQADVDLLRFWIPFGIVCLVLRLGVAAYQSVAKNNSDNARRALAAFYLFAAVGVVVHLGNLISDIGFRATVEVLAKADVGTVLLFGAICTLIRVDLHYGLKGGSENFYREALSRIGRWIQEVADAMVYAGLLVFLIIRPFFIQTFIIPSPSMVPTLLKDDILIVDKFTYRFVRDPVVGEVVVFKPPDAARELVMQPPGTDFVKRLIGAPGDLIEIRDGVTYRNGAPIAEPYVQNPPCMPEAEVRDFKIVNYNNRLVAVQRRFDPFRRPVVVVDSIYGIPSAQFDALWELPAERLPAGQYLLIGDNRTQSYDGRFWGPIPRHQIVGKLWWRIFRVSRPASYNPCFDR